MIEERINVLIQSIDCLTAAIQQLFDRHGEVFDAKAPVVSTDPPKVKKEVVKKEDTKSETEKLEIVTHDVLHNLCLKIVRKSPNAKNKIKEILDNRLIKELAQDELVAVKVKLEKL